MKLIMENWQEYTEQSSINESLWKNIKNWMTLGAADSAALLSGQTPTFVANQLIDPKKLPDLKGRELINFLLAARRGYKAEAEEGKLSLRYDTPATIVSYIDQVLAQARLNPEKSYAQLFPELSLSKFKKAAAKTTSKDAEATFLKKSEDLIKKSSSWLTILAAYGGQMMEENKKRDK
jgi:hypothetical protein